MKTRRLRVVLCDVEPALARVIDVPATATLDLIDTSNWRVWTIGRSAQSFLPRASMLAEIWAHDE